MRAIHLVAVDSGVALGPPGAPRAALTAGALLAELGPDLERAFGVPCLVAPEALDASFAFDPIRNQHHSTAILRRLADGSYPADGRVLGVTELDLFVPILTFVFGEAQLEGRCALVSVHRLREEFYGLPPQPALLRERLLKEAVHEIGHTFGLRHCLQWDCVMASTHAVERLDLKGSAFCASCAAAVQAESARKPP